MTGFLPPPWIKLDHSANIYPATMSKRLAAMFRLSIMLNEQIDPCILQQALIKTLHRFPSFNYRLKKGLFWHYFEWQTVEPTIQPDAVNPLISIVSRDEGYFLFRVRYFKSTIALEVFHALTDGNGGIIFLLTLTAVYLQMRHGISITPGKYVLDTNALPDSEEMEDSFGRYMRTTGMI